MSEILILTDYRGAFHSTVATQRTLCTMNISRISGLLRDFGHEVETRQFSEVDFRRDYRNVHLLYTSSEDIGLAYRSYLEDVILALQLSGAEPIPHFPYLRAHHNKSMMEMLRYRLFPKDAEAFGTRVYGTYEELVAQEPEGGWPKVVKSAYGAGSRQVARADDRRTLLSTARRLSRTWDPGDVLRELRRRVLWRDYPRSSLHRGKFVVQQLVDGLDGDFKVLRYGRRYYVLYRRNRPADFRASGSGRFTGLIPDEIETDQLLDYARGAAEIIGTPCLSLDIGYDGRDFHLIEFQCLHFGTLTAERSTRHWMDRGGRWEERVEPCDLELVFSEAIHEHLTS
ncbi:MULTISPECIES: hypothetical protein [unclassified Micromonospora]|uniref:hypothetical protein n=1 Tax=unclassified Micromonospora TaxID=2617518 RepID=UPI003327187E